MKLRIKSTRLQLTPALVEYAEKKLLTLSRLVSRWDRGGAVAMEVEIAKSTQHHRKGPVFYAEANLRLPGVLLRAEEFHEDLHVAITKVRAKLRQEILKCKAREIAR